MRQENAFKIRLIKLLEILRQHSDEDNYMSTTEIIERLAAIGIVCDRRTLYKDVELLNESGYEVLWEKSPEKPNGYCVADRSFDAPELRILMDAVVDYRTAINYLIDYAKRNGIKLGYTMDENGYITVA